MTNVRSLKTIISELCIHTEDLHHAIVLFEEPVNHTIQVREAFFGHPMELEVWLRDRINEYDHLKLPYATWVDGEFTNHGIEIWENEK